MDFHPGVKQSLLVSFHASVHVEDAHNGDKASCEKQDLRFSHYILYVGFMPSPFYIRRERNSQNFFIKRKLLTSIMLLLKMVLILTLPKKVS